MRTSPVVLVLAVAVALAGAAGAQDRALTDGFVGCSTSDNAYPFDLDTHTAGASIDLLPEGDYPYDATITPDGSQVWFVGASGDGVVVIDRATNAVIQRLAVADYAIGVAFNQDGSRAFVTSRNDELLKIIDTATFAEVGSLPLPTDYLGAGNIALDPVSGNFYVVDWYSDNLLEVAADGSAVLRSADFGTSLWQVVVAPDGEHVYVTDRGEDQVVEIATGSFAITRTFPLGDDPWGLDITADGSTLVAACEDNSSVYLVDLQGAAVTPIALDPSADPRDVDILDDSGLAFVAGGTVEGYAGAVYVINLETALIDDIVDGPGTNANVVAVQAQMAGGTTGVETPAAVAGIQAYPNPFNPRVTVALTLARDTRGVLTVHDLAGRLVRTLASGDFPAGRVDYTWNGRDGAGRSLPSGVYVLRLAGQGVNLHRKVVLME